MNLNAQEVLTREIQGVQREVTKVAKQVGKALEDNARRFREIGLWVADLRGRTGASLDGLAAEALKRVTECRSLEQEADELQGLSNPRCARAEDIDRLDASIATSSGRVGTNARQVRDFTFPLGR